MSNFERLQGHVEEGSIRVVHIEAVPRSVSTALARALNETEEPSVYINEPFNRRKYDIEEASGHILDAADPLLDKTDGRLTVVTKNMARNISTPIFRDWMPICDSVVWSVRDPRIQMASMLTRIANDLEHEPGADVITQDELGSHLERVSAFLEDGPVSKDFDKTSWADMGAHFRSGFQPERSVVVDGGDFSADPLRVLSGACKRIGLAFSERMVDGWQGNFINANSGYSDTLSDAEHAWTREAVTSTGVVSLTRVGLNPADLPPALQAHLTEVAIPIYEEMVESNQYVG